MFDEFPEMQIHSLSLGIVSRDYGIKSGRCCNTEQTIQQVLMSDACWDMMRGKGFVSA